jgi:alkaline phosphatase D
MPERIYNMDSWAGYETPRRRLLSRMRGLGNVVVLTGDEHQNFAGVLEDRGRPVAVEFVSTSISSGGDGADLRPGSDVMRANNPQVRFLNDQRGYLACTVTPDAWATDFMTVDRVSSPGGAIAKRATATLERGKVDVTLS